MALIGAAHRKLLLPVAGRSWATGRSMFDRLEPGAGTFRFDGVTVGLVFSEQPRHEARYGADRVRPLPLAPGQGWIFPAGMDGWCAWTEPQELVNIVLAAELVIAAGLPDPAAVPVSAGDLDPLTAELVFALHGAPPAAPTLSRDSLAHALAGHLVARSRAAAPAPPLVDRRLRRALDYLEAHLAEDIALADLAAAAGLSPFHFARSFKAATGLPPHRYLVVRRMERAKAILAAGPIRVAEVAGRVGYRDTARFAALFRRYTGTTPGAWRAGRR